MTRLIPPTPNLLWDMIRRLRAHGIPSPRVEASALLQEMRQRHGTEERKRCLLQLYRRRVRREPIAYLSGWQVQEFDMHLLHVDRSVLIPRHDTEALVQAACAALPPQRTHNRPVSVLDLGTGSGCLLISLLYRYPGSRGVGVDISDAALHIARMNLQTHGLLDRALLIHGDWASDVRGVFDLIVSNPPYICSYELQHLQPEVSRYEPHVALDGGPDGLTCYRHIAPDLQRLLAPHGVAVVEIGDGMVDAVERVVVEAGLSIRGRGRDLGGAIRCLVLSSGSSETNL